MYTSICNPCKQDFQSLIPLIRDERVASPIVLYSPMCAVLCLIEYRLDALLRDSVLFHDLTMISGTPGSGKTQLAMTILCRCLQMKRRVLYVNCGCNFVLDRVTELLMEMKADVDACLSLLYLENAMDAFDVFDLVDTFSSVLVFNLLQR